MKTLPADLEALMPKASLFYRDMDGRSPGSMTSQQPVFTADQVREAMLAATERDARICDGLVYALDNGGNRYRREADASKCAAAIRSGGEAGL